MPLRGMERNGMDIAPLTTMNDQLQLVSCQRNLLGFALYKVCDDFINSGINEAVTNLVDQVTSINVCFMSISD